jgi:hypothetical protein
MYDQLAQRMAGALEATGRDLTLLQNLQNGPSLCSAFLAIIVIATPAGTPALPGLDGGVLV